MPINACLHLIMFTGNPVRTGKRGIVHTERKRRSVHVAVQRPLSGRDTVCIEVMGVSNDSCTRDKRWLSSSERNDWRDCCRIAGIPRYATHRGTPCIPDQ